MGEIKDKIVALREQIDALRQQMTALQDTCTHPAYERGYSIIACVQEVLFCTECGHMKPLHPFTDEEQKWLA